MAINGTNGDDTRSGTSAADVINGLDGNDQLYGLSGNDTIYGGAGNDTIVAAVGNDFIDGGTGHDVFSPHILDGHGNDTYIGGDGNDSFFDPLGKDSLLGGKGNDFFLVEIVKLSGSDEPFGAEGIATGGEGRDTYSMGQALWQGAESGYQITYTVTDFKAGANGDLIDVSNLLLASTDTDLPSPYQGGNPFASSQGYLRLVQQGADTLLQFDLGGKNEADPFATVLRLRNVQKTALTADNFVGGISPTGAAVAGEVIDGTSEGDALEGGFFNDTMNGGDGADTLDGGGANDVITGGLGDDLIRGGPGNDTLNGGDGDDTFIVTTAGNASRAYGEAGRDTYVVEPAANGRGFSVLDFTAGADGDLIDVYDLILKSAQPGQFNDANLFPYTGGNPFDEALGYLRWVDFDGGTKLQWDQDSTAGTNFPWRTVLTLNGVSSANLTADNIVDGIPPQGTMPGGLSFDGTVGDESMRGGIADDTLTGDEGNDHLRGSAGNDNLDGGDGDDTLLGGLGDDLVTGGAGADITQWIGGAPGVDHHVDQVGNDTIYGGDGEDLVADFWGNNWLDGGNDVDHFIVQSHDNGISTITGGLGSDLFSVGTTTKARHHVVLDFTAGAGGDLLEVEQLLGASGFTTGNPFDLGFLELRLSGADTLLFWDRDGAAGPKAKLKVLTLKDVLPSEITSDNFFGQHVVGTEGNDKLFGGLGNDTVQGLGGNDTLDGSLGGDTLQGGSGNDLYVVDDIGDQVIEDSNSTGSLVLPGSGAGGAVAGITDTVKASIDYALGNFVEHLTLTGSAAQGTGNSLNNKITGNAGADTLDGGAGRDTLDGGSGADSLLGGEGNDVLVWGGDDTLDGGAELDTVKVKSGTLDMTALGPTRIVAVETVDLRGAGKTLKLTAQDVLDMTSAGTLKVMGDAGDVVDVTGLTRSGSVSGLNRYIGGGATLLVETDLSVV